MLVICAGMARSGSTVQYQIVCEIIESLGLGMTIGWVNVPNKEFLDNLENAAFRKDKFLVVKSHNFSDAIKTRVETGKVKVVYVYRDLRDVVVSLANKFANSTEDAIGRLSHLLNNYYLWTALDSIMISRYENMVADLYSEVIRISHYLGIEITHDLAIAIANKLEISQQKEKIKNLNEDCYSIKDASGDVYDPVSQLHKNHINSGKWGQWKEFLSKKQIEYIENLAFSWFVDQNYPLSSFKKDEAKSAIHHFKQARKIKKEGKLSEAANSYRQAIMLSPRSSLYHYNLGEVLLKLGQIDPAINAYRHAISLNPVSALSHQGLGAALSISGQLNKAVEHYRQAVKIKPNTPRFQNSLNQGLADNKSKS